MSLHCNQKKNTNLYYTFGWTGLLSPKARYHEATKMFLALEKEVGRLKKNGINPKIRIIGYSHGGSVCLNLGAIHQKKFPLSPLIIDELFLLGTPIQRNTDFLINDPMFKKIYNIFSAKDQVQRLDFFCPGQLFSQKIFKQRKNFKLPKKLIQIQFKVIRSRKSKRKIDTIKNGKNLDTYGVVSGNSDLLRDVSPGHGELWAFGWAPPYRTTYPLYPLPSLCFVPLISELTKNIKPIKPHDILLFDVRPDHELILITDKSTLNVHKVVPFMSPNNFESLKNNMLKIKPAAFNEDTYKEHVQAAIAQGKEIYEQQLSGALQERREKKSRKKRKNKHR